MRTFLRVLLWGLAGLVVVVLCAATAVFIVSQSKLSRRYQASVKPVAVPTDVAAVERGRHVAQIRGCLDCHGQDAGGAKVIDDPAMGKLYGPNLTHGVGGLKAAYANVDWVRAIRHGIGSDGRTLVLMPSAEYAGMSDDDLGALIAYLQSLPSVDRASVPVKLGPVARVLVAVGKMPLAAAELDHAHVEPSHVVPGVTVEYGRYLAVGCVGCHNPAYSGGKIALGPPDWPPAANLTRGPGGAMTGWNEADFIRTLRTRRRPDGKALSSVMPPSVGQMNDMELKALWAFLQTLPPRATGQRG